MQEEEGTDQETWANSFLRSTSLLVNALLSDAKIIIRSPTSPYLLTFLLPSTGTLLCHSSVLRKCFFTSNKRRESGETMRRLISPSTKESLFTLLQTPRSTLLYSLFLLVFPSLTPPLLIYLFILLYINPLINASHYNVKKMKINHKLEIEGRNKQSMKIRFGVYFLMARSSCRCTKPTSRPGRKEKEACRTQKKNVSTAFLNFSCFIRTLLQKPVTLPELPLVLISVNEVYFGLGTVKHIYLHAQSEIFDLCINIC